MLQPRGSNLMRHLGNRYTIFLESEAIRLMSRMYQGKVAEVVPDLTFSGGGRT